MNNSARNRSKLFLPGLCFALALLANNANAYTGSTWDPQGTSGGAPTSGNWEDLSWTTSTTEAAQSPTVAFVENEAACFAVGDAASTNTHITITMNSGHNVAGLFNGPLGPASCVVTINGPGIMTITPAGLQGFNDGGSTPGWTIINAQIAGPASLTPEGAGQLFLNGTNTYTGGTTLGFNQGSVTGIINFNNSSSFGTGTIIISNASGCGLAGPASGAVTIPNAVSWQQPLAHVNFVGNSSGVTFSGSWTLVNTATVGSGNSVGNIVTISGKISGAGGINKYNPATLKLAGTNTYTGATTVSNGVFALAATGSINSTPSITLAPGANGTIFDVSAISAYTLSSSTTLLASGTGTATATEAAIKGASGGTVSLASRPVILNFTPIAFTGDTTHPPLYISQGALTLNNNTITITNAAATALGTGTYRLIQVGNGTSGTINGIPNATPVIAGTGITSGATALLVVSNGNLNLVVRPAATFSTLTLSESNTFGIGATSVTLSNSISGGSVHPASNETVGVTINGDVLSATVKGTSGGFSLTVDPVTVPVAASNYPVTLTYPGDAGLSPVTNSTTLPVNVFYVNDSLPNFPTGLIIFCTNTAGIPMFTWSTTNPGLPVTDWSSEGAMFEQPLNDGSGNSRYSSLVTPTNPLVYYVSGPAVNWPFYSPAGVGMIATDTNGNNTYTPTNIAVNARGVLALPLPPTVVVPPANQTVLAGKNATFNVTVTGSAPETYQWFFNTSTSVLVPTTNSPLVITNVTTNQSGLYSVTVTNQYGATNSTTALLTVLPPPQLTSQTLSNGSFQLSGIAAPGEKYYVEMATNISPPVAWVPILTNTTDTNGLAQYNESNGATSAGRFFRLAFP